MNVEEIKTRKILPPQDSLDELLVFVPKLSERSILAISSKVLSICEGNTKPINSISHELLVNKLSDKVLEPLERSSNDMVLTQVEDVLVESAGVDVSNANGYYVLLPKQPYESAMKIWKYIRKRDKIKNLGIIITDSRSLPRRKGAIGFSLASYGFKSSHVYKNKKDIFGRESNIAASNLADSIAASAVLVMGEGAEQTPMAIVTGLNRIEYFKTTVPISLTKQYGWVEPKLDVYGPILESNLWSKKD